MLLTQLSSALSACACAVRLHSLVVASETGGEAVGLVGDPPAAVSAV